MYTHTHMHAHRERERNATSGKLWRKHNIIEMASGKALHGVGIKALYDASNWTEIQMTGKTRESKCRTQKESRDSSHNLEATLKFKYHYLDLFT